MYKGFNLILDNDEYFDKYFRDGRTLYREQQQIINEKIDDFLDEKGVLLASRLEANWFPLQTADIFISHSHADEKLAISLAGFLHKEMGLTAFVDSCLWGSSRKLLKLIDKRFCYKKSSETYDYEMRNRSTSYIYMMLNVSLAKMIDGSESAFFLNTPRSMTPSDVIEGNEGSTMSPWLYSEISMTRLIRQKTKNEHRQLVKSVTATNESFDGAMEAKFDIDVSHLIKLRNRDFVSWLIKTQIEGHHGVNCLDALYQMKNIR